MEHREISTLKVNPNNPRGEVVVDESLRELAASVEAHGILQPILITPDGTIVAGHRRHKAAELVGQRTIPVMIRDLSESEQIQIMLVENLQREGLTALQTAKAYDVLTKHGLTIREIAKATGFNSASISSHLSILSLPQELHEHFDSADGLPLGCVRHLLELPLDEQLEIGRQAVERRLTKAQIAFLVKKRMEGSSPVRRFRKPAPVLTVDLNDIVERLEIIDDDLEKFPEMKRAKTLLREASRILISAITGVGKSQSDTDLSDTREPVFRGAIDAFQRQPQEGRGWKAS